MTMNLEPRQNNGPTSLKHLFRETYDLVDEAVANTTDEQIDDRLRAVLRKAGYSEKAAATEPNHPLPVAVPHRGRGATEGPDLEDDRRQDSQLVYAEGELVQGHRREVERDERALDLQLAEQALALREREMALQAQQAELEERRENARHRRELETIEVHAKIHSERRAPVRRMITQIVIATVTVSGYTVSAWVNAVSLPSLSISAAVLLYLGLVLVVTLRATRGSDRERESAYQVLQVLWPFHRLTPFFRGRDRGYDSAQTARQKAPASEQELAD
ncbi:hypothetical protein ACFFX1_49280 [Dactylosporangium sucinum]|uniref:Uncharacterized protein n=1 Tax=Dactylosporangium sucinum TaxID=1424081 RepID=A0A917X8K5_9ACTN|nr:hypothetical protein [Dactylosporangium sucinum]GGM89948.1 hypothetical protein GCM10007977_110020 [Dactylosporangium sucinum]